MTIVFKAPRAPVRDVPPESPAAKPDGLAQPMEWPFEPLHGLIARRARVVPGALALVDGELSWTYQRLDSTANRLARHLREHGAKPGTLVAVCLPRGADAVVSFLAVLKTGAGFLPLDPVYPHERRAHKLTDANPVVLITRRSLLGDMPGHGAHTVLVDDDDHQAAVQAHGTDALPVDSRAADTAYVIYTSGSTGKPKGVMVPHGALVPYAESIVDRYALTPTDRVLQFASLAFDICIEEIFPTLLSGACLVLHTDPAANSLRGFLDMVERRGITVLNLPTAFWHELVLALDDDDLKVPPSVRLLVVGGEKASRALHTRWVERVGAWPRFMNAYGPTETTVTATVYEPAACPADDREAELPIGKPLPHCTCHVLDDSLRPVPAGSIGELFIGGRSVATGYLNQPDRTLSRFVPDPFSAELGARMYRTGDRVRQLPDGNLEFHGRVDHQLKVRGYRIEAVEIEGRLEQHPAVAQAVVVGFADVSGNTALAAFCRMRAESSWDEAALRRFLAGLLPAYMIPARFVEVHGFTMMPNGKVDRSALVLTDAAPGAAATPPQTPGLASAAGRAIPSAPDPGASRDDFERWMAPVFAEVLGMPRIDATLDFFDAGGHSLLALRLVSRLDRQRPELSITIERLFAYPSVRQLAAALADQLAPGRSSPETGVVRLNSTDPRIESSTPLFCVCGVALYGPLARALADERPVYGVFLQAEIDAARVGSSAGAGLDMPAMATRYIEVIRSVRRTGPYRLAGISFGATMAFEIAHQLRAQGEAVELLTLLDPVLNRSLGPLALVERVSRRVKRWWRGPWGRNHAAGVDDQRLEERRNQAMDAAEERYEQHLRPYAGRALIVSATGIDGWHPPTPRPDLGWYGRFAKPDLGWLDVLSPGTLVVQVPGDHLGILAPPGARQIATAMRRADESLPPR
jgi:amino acid adenylation domain-containing protein